MRIQSSFRVLGVERYLANEAAALSRLSSIQREVTVQHQARHSPYFPSKVICAQPAQPPDDSTVGTGKEAKENDASGCDSLKRLLQMKLATPHCYQRRRNAKRRTGESRNQRKRLSRTVPSLVHCCVPLIFNPKDPKKKSIRKNKRRGQMQELRRGARSCKPAAVCRGHTRMAGTAKCPTPQTSHAMV